MNAPIHPSRARQVMPLIISDALKARIDAVVRPLGFLTSTGPNGHTSLQALSPKGRRTGDFFNFGAAPACVRKAIKGLAQADGDAA